MTWVFTSQWFQPIGSIIGICDTPFGHIKTYFFGQIPVESSEIIPRHFMDFPLLAILALPACSEPCAHQLIPPPMKI